MFHKILIANRGEIACRVMQTAHRLGLRSVAVYSDADADAKHVALADEAVHLGGPAPADSYLCGDRIIAAALKTGAEAIHPGYGFLSENPDFVAAVEEAGLVFIGPSPQAIAKMGLKDAAKLLMQKAGVPVTPGYIGANQAPTQLKAEAEKIGYPLLIKAVAGGGGKGMRLVERSEDFRDALDRAKAEARTAFGNDHVLLEKFITSPRHIEVQIFGDGTRAVHLFERDCSLQRRHQKVIEEAPAPGMSAEMRAQMGAAAVRAAEAIGYKGAGTVEFIVDGSDGLRPDRFWFMEMNTRLQVEHPVTEAITGIDLVEWQLRVASGEDLPARQDDLSITGHAFEARLYAEDVPAGFLPATGRLAHLRFPDGLRADSGVRSGDAISPHYDPMIAKLTVHGPTRGAALQSLARGLDETQVAGTVTNLAFLRALAGHKGFAAGQVDTGVIARDLDHLTASTLPDARIWAQAALWAARLDAPSPQRDGFALWQPLSRSLALRHAGEDAICVLRVTRADQIEIGTPEGSVLAEYRAGRWWFNGAPGADMFREAEHITVFTGGGLSFQIVDPLDRQQRAGPDSGITLAPMPGRVVSVHVRPGQIVAEGDRLAVLEAMKMEHVMIAASAGKIAEVLVSQGDQVEAGAPLIQMDRQEETA